MAKAINIIIDEKRRGPEAYFVEIENDDGKSISIGERIESGGYTKIRITPEDIVKTKRE